MSSKMSNIELAKKLIERANNAGCRATIEGEWVVWRPPLPSAMIVEAMHISKEIAQIVRSTLDDALLDHFPDTGEKVPNATDKGSA